MLNDCSCGEPLFEYIEVCPKCGATNPAATKVDEGHKGRVLLQGFLDDVTGWLHHRQDDSSSVHIYTHGPSRK